MNTSGDLQAVELGNLGPDRGFNAVVNSDDPVGSMGTDKPIGALLSEYRIESRRDILVIDREPAGPCGGYFGIAPSAPTLFRTYRIVAGGHPISLITEKFPAAAFLAVNGIALLIFERLRRRPPRTGDYLGDADARIAKLSWRQAIAVGTSQAAALVPGISRSGFSMGGGLVVGLSNEDAARYSFLLATPVILAAAALKLPELLGTQGNGVRGPAFVAALCAAATTFFAVKFLLRFFQTNRLTPFGIYCIGFGLTCTLVFALGG